MARMPLSDNSDWELVHSDQDIRGWAVQDHAGNRIGKVRELIANTETERIDTVVLDDGREFSASEIELGDDVVYVRGTETGTETGDTFSTGKPVVRAYNDARVSRRN